MTGDPLVMLCTCDIAGQVRGKAIPLRALERRREIGVGWTPTNLMITAHGAIAPSPWGSRGDLYLRPDPETLVRVEIGEERVVSFALADVMELDGRPWSCCPRGFLKRAIAALAERGLCLRAAFEQEFALLGVEERPNSPYNLDAFRRQGRFGERFFAALREAGIAPDTFMPEYGPAQYEVTIDHAEALQAADQAVQLREIARATAESLGLRATFTPVLRPDAVGNGVHVHFSLIDRDGRPCNFDPARPFGLSATAEAFLEGIRRHLRALCALTAAAVTSYLRLVPNRWSAAWTNVGHQDREAAIRICPVFRPGSEASALHFEYRAADAAASPHLLLGALIWAGMHGLDAGARLSTVTTRDPADMPEEERDRHDIRRLPTSLGEALDELEGCTPLREAMGDTLHRVYLAHKRFEVELMAELDPLRQCERYALLY